MNNEELVFQIQQGIDSAKNMEQLYLQNKGLIFSVIKRYRYACQSGYDSVPIIEMDELMHEAYFGLIKAVEGFNPEHGVLFSTYAIPWIRQVVKRFLDGSGKVIRVPVHTQEKVYRYNQITSHYLQNFNREPSVQEYARWLYISEQAVMQLQRFMFRDKVKSLDVPVAGGEEENINYTDTVASDTDLEGDVIEKVSQEQLQAELWDIIGQILKDERKVQILRLKFEQNLSLRDIGKVYHVTGPAIDCLIRNSLKLIKRNARIRRLAIELNLWDADKPFSANRVKLWCDCGRYSSLDKKEMQYAVRMGWVHNTTKKPLGSVRLVGAPR